MFPLEDLFEDDLYEEIKADVEEECKQFGKVLETVIPVPDTKSGVSPASVGKVFVQYEYIIHAKKARHNLCGRTYNKRTVMVSFYPEEKF